MTVRVTAAGRMSTTFASLRYPNYRRWFIGQVLSLAGTWMQSVAQGWLVYQLTGSSLSLGAVTAAGTIPAGMISTASSTGSGTAAMSG